jgi:hypothetical protein
MQSEMACHIGSMGKHFCRVCKVKGHDAGMESTFAPAAATQPQAGDSGESASESEAYTGNDAPAKSTRKRAKETMDEMVTRVKRFIKVINLSS